MMKTSFTQFTTTRDKCWLLLFLGFTIANFQLIGLALVEPSAINFFNCLVGLTFLGLVISVRPLSLINPKD